MNILVDSINETACEINVQLAEHPTEMRILNVVFMEIQGDKTGPSKYMYHSFLLGEWTGVTQKKCLAHENNALTVIEHTN